ncbi:MAG: hypothetical protein R6U61_05230 [Thermoplasmata archaeon]
MFPTYADTYSLNLSAEEKSEGWQFISLPILPHDESIEEVLKYIEGSYDKVMHYDSTDGRWETTVVNRTEHYNDFTEINHTMGFWVHMTSEDTLVIGGNKPVSTDIVLQPGWNMVGYASATDRLANDTLPSEVTKIGVFNASREYNIEYIYDLTTYTMTAGEGYWVYNDANYDAVWTVEY